jgi:hypothetical protein
MAMDLEKLEETLKNLIEKHAVRVFAGIDVEDKLVSELVQALRTELEQDPSGSGIAPHIFALSVNPKYAQDIRSNQTLLEKLSKALLEAGKENNLEFDSSPSITIFPDESVEEGDFHINAMRSRTSLETQGVVPSPSQDDTRQVPPRAFLIVGGSKIFSLEQDAINIGRKLSNALVLDDARVSRNHAQLRAVKGRFMLFDLNSSGGTFVNGKRITQTVLHPGDVISLAGVPMVYGQDAVRAVSETQEYKPPKHTSDEHTTTSIDLNDLDLDDFS